jgi:hypothetical protein
MSIIIKKRNFEWKIILYYLLLSRPVLVARLRWVGLHRLNSSETFSFLDESSSHIFHNVLRQNATKMD